MQVSRGADRHGRGPICGAAVAELSYIISSPTVGFTDTGHTTCMGVTSTDRRKGNASRHIDRNRYGALHGSSAVAQLPIIISPPTVGCARTRESTRMLTTSTNRRKGNVSRHIDRHGRGPICGVAVAELSYTIFSPTVGFTDTRHATRMESTSIDRRKGNASRHIDRNRYGALRGSAVAELSYSIVSPTVGCARTRQTTRVGRTNTDRCKSNTSWHAHRRRPVQGIWYDTVGPGLPICVLPPAVDYARTR